MAQKAEARAFHRAVRALDKAALDRADAIRLAGKRERTKVERAADDRADRQSAKELRLRALRFAHACARAAAAAFDEIGGGK